MTKQGLLNVRPENVNGKVRKYYSITQTGEVVQLQAEAEEPKPAVPATVISGTVRSKTSYTLRLSS
ncbi:MAG: hypothetical protein R2881_06735 [Eubacteriales bacterium]